MRIGDRVKLISNDFKILSNHTTTVTMNQVYILEHIVNDSFILSQHGVILLVKQDGVEQLPSSTWNNYTMQELREVLGNKDTIISNLNKDISDLLKDRNDLKAKLVSKEGDIAHLQVDMDKVKAERSSTLVDLKRSETRRQELFDELTRRGEKVANISCKVIELRLTEDKLISELQSNKKELLELRKEVAELKDRNTKIYSNLEKRNNRIVQVNAICDEQKKVIADQKEKLSWLHVKVRVRDTQIKELEDVYEELEKRHTVAPDTANIGISSEAMVRARDKGVLVNKEDAED